MADWFDFRFSLDDEVQMTVDPGTGFWDFGDLESTGYQNPWVGGTKMAPFDKPVSSMSINNCLYEWQWKCKSKTVIYLITFFYLLFLSIKHWLFIFSAVFSHHQLGCWRCDRFLPRWYRWKPFQAVDKLRFWCWWKLLEWSECSLLIIIQIHKYLLLLLTDGWKLHYPAKKKEIYHR